MTAGFWYGFCRSGLKAPQSSVLWGRAEMARGKAPSLSSPPSILPDGSWTEQVDEKTGGRVDGQRHMGRVGCGDLGGRNYWGAQVKGQCPLSA